MPTYTFITGATSDIGKQICHTLDDNGHILLMTDLNEEALKELCLELKQNNEHKYLALDLSKVEESKEIFQHFIGENEIKISNVVYAAGIFTVKPIKTLDYQFIKTNFDIAIFSSIMLTQVLASKKYNGSNLQSIVFLSSISAKMGTKGYVTYGAVKASMIGAMKSMAAELSPRVRVNAVLPGGVKTKATAFLYEMTEANPRYLLGNGEKNDIANMIEFLLSDKAKWITGQEFVVDGGMTCN